MERSGLEPGKGGAHVPSFTTSEAEFRAENFHGRIATVSPDGQPQAVPVTYRFDGIRIIFGGWNLKNSLNFRNLVANKGSPSWSTSWSLSDLGG